MSLSKINFFIYFFAAFGFTIFSPLKSQNNIYEAFDKIVGLENTGLYNGTEFTDPFLNTDGTFRYYNGFDFSKGSVTYNGQFFSSVSLKYDLLEDNLLTRSDDNLGIFIVQMIPEFVEAFSIYNKYFVRLNNTRLSFAGNGFFEIGYLGKNMDLYIKRTKKKKDRPINNSVQYRFSKENFYVLKARGQYSEIRNSKDVWQMLPEWEEQIKDFSRTYKALYKANPELFMVKLIGHIDALNQNAPQ